MWQFAANLTMLWTDRDIYARFAAAAASGFSRVELLFPQLLDADSVTAALDEHRLSFVLFDARPGDWEVGERGLLGLPGREEELRESVEEALRLAKIFHTRRINILSGIVPAGTTPAECIRVAAENLRRMAPLAEREGVLLLIEPLNDVDVPGYLVPTVDEAAALVEAADSPAVRLQFDQYHVGMSGDDPVSSYRRHAHLVEHVQIADVPGRHEPGTGMQPIGSLLEELSRMNYEGSVGLEYIPSGKTEDSLAWLGSR